MQHTGAEQAVEHTDFPRYIVEESALAERGFTFLTVSPRLPRENITIPAGVELRLMGTFSSESGTASADKLIIYYPTRVELGTVSVEDPEFYTKVTQMRADGYTVEQLDITEDAFGYRVKED